MNCRSRRKKVNRALLLPSQSARRPDSSPRAVSFRANARDGIGSSCDQRYSCKVDLVRPRRLGIESGTPLFPCPKSTLHLRPPLVLWKSKLHHYRRQRSAPAIANESRMVGIRKAKMAIWASSSLKRSRTLPNCSREDRIRDGPFKCQG